MYPLQNPFHKIPAFRGEDLIYINVLVEIVSGSNVKYEYDKEHGIVMVDRILKTPMPYPFNYGLIPQTWNNFDNDPLDVIILGDNTFTPGVLVPCKIIGMLNVDDDGERDDKVIAIAQGDSSLSNIENLSDIDKKKLDSIIYFLEHYKDLENKKVSVNGQVGKKETIDFITECQSVYVKKFNK